MTRLNVRRSQLLKGTEFYTCTNCWILSASLNWTFTSDHVSYRWYTEKHDFFGRTQRCMIEVVFKIRLCARNTLRIQLCHADFRFFWNFKVSKKLTTKYMIHVQFGYAGGSRNLSDLAWITFCCHSPLLVIINYFV